MKFRLIRVFRSPKYSCFHQTLFIGTLLYTECYIQWICTLLSERKRCATHRARTLRPKRRYFATSFCTDTKGPLQSGANLTTAQSGTFLGVAGSGMLSLEITRKNKIIRLLSGTHKNAAQPSPEPTQIIIINYY